MVHALAEVRIGELVLSDSAMFGNEVKNGPAKDLSHVNVAVYVQPLLG